MAIELSEDRIEEIATRSAMVAVENVLLRLGIDTDDPGAFREVRENLQFAGRLRRQSETVGKVSLKVIVTTAVGGFLTALYIVVLAMIQKNGGPSP